LEPLNPEKPALDITIFPIVNRVAFSHLSFIILSSKKLKLTEGKVINGHLRADISPEIAKLSGSGQFKPKIFKLILIKTFKSI
jgi:hypothetical protein